MRYADIKTLIYSKCAVKDVILDNLVTDGQNKKVTVGLAEEEDAAMLARQINGLFFEGKQLYVEDLRKKKASQQPFRPTRNYYESSNTDTQRGNNQSSTHSSPTKYPQQLNYQQGHYTNQMSGFQSENFGNHQPVNQHKATSAMMQTMGGMDTNDMYMPEGQNSYYGGQSQPAYPSSAAQYSLFPVQQGEPMSGSDLLTPKEDEWTRKRRAQISASQQDNDYGRGNQSTYNSDTRQNLERWGRGGDVAISRRRSRSPCNKRQRLGDGSGISTKRARNEDNNIDFSRHNSYRDSQRLFNREETNTSQTYRDSQRLFNREETNTSQTYRDSQRLFNREESNTSQTYRDSQRLFNRQETNTSQTYRDSQRLFNQEETYTSQNYGSRDQNQRNTLKTYSSNGNENKPYYNNDSITATSSISQPQAYMSLPAYNLWNAETIDPATQDKIEDVFSDSVPYEDQKDSWECKDPISMDSRSNYRKHMEMKAVQRKNDWINPARTSWDTQDPTSYGGEIRSKCTWWNPNIGKNDTETSSFTGQSCAPAGDKPLPKSSPLFDKPQPIHNAPKAHNNLKNNWPNKPKKNKKKLKKSIMPVIRQDSTFRFQAAGTIATEIRNAHPDIIKEEYLKYLQKSVRSRLEVLLAERIGESLPQMINIYRQKFPASMDRDFCRLIVEEIPVEVKTTLGLTANIKTEGIKKENSKPNVVNTELAARQTQPTAGRSQPTAAKSRPKVTKNSRIILHQAPSQSLLPPLNLPKPTEKLPKYPNSNKSVYKEQKKIKKLEHQNENMYALTPHLYEALEEELKIITDIYISVASKPDSEIEQGLCDRFLTVGLEQVRKIIKMNVTKRILNINTNLIIRVYSSGKPPKKQDVEAFLRKQKVVSMKKSDKRKIIYVATCRDFASYDRLCTMGSVTLNKDTVLLIKPFQLAGPKLSFKERKELQARRARFLEGNAAVTFTTNLDHPVETEQNKEGMKKEPNEGQDKQDVRHNIDGQVDQQDVDGQDNQHDGDVQIDQHDGDREFDQHNDDKKDDQHDVDGQDDQHNGDRQVDQHDDDEKDDQHNDDEKDDQHNKDGQVDQHDDDEEYDQLDDDGQDDQHDYADNEGFMEHMELNHEDLEDY